LLTSIKDGAAVTLAETERPLFVIQADKSALFDFVRDDTGNGPPATRLGALREADLEPCSVLQMADWLNLGLLLYKLSTGTALARGAEYKGGAIKPAALDDLVLRMLQSNAEARMGFVGLIEFQHHPFFAGVDWSFGSVPKVIVDFALHRL
jgi:hypothetical protein